MIIDHLRQSHHRLRELPLITVILYYGFFPLVTALFFRVLLPSFSFPGFCDYGDGVHCFPPGVAGYFELSPFSIDKLFVLAFLAFIFPGGFFVFLPLFIWSVFIARLARFGLKCFLLTLVLQVSSVFAFVVCGIDSAINPKTPLGAVPLKN